MIARCFVALEIGAQALGAADEAQRLLDATVVRKTAPASMHVTLKFLGEVDVDAVAREVFAAIAPLADGPPMALGEGRVEGFPSTGRAHVVVLECAGVDPRVAELASRAEDAAAALGVAREERAFRPHLTLARSKRDYDARKIAARFGARPLGLAGRLVLMESTASGYAVLASVSPTTPRSESC